ncbi:hypothetical protein [Tunturiibacter gelidiferens]|uniref:hypothetical protein n=1 Tax=Tunturiibacter gelidiferens TaxID=3069689 RepID=UPI003D9BF6E7
MLLITFLVLLSSLGLELFRGLVLFHATFHAAMAVIAPLGHEEHPTRTLAHIIDLAPIRELKCAHQRRNLALRIRSDVCLTWTEIEQGTIANGMDLGYQSVAAEHVIQLTVALEEAGEVNVREHAIRVAAHELRPVSSLKSKKPNDRFDADSTLTGQCFAIQQFN